MGKFQELRVWKEVKELALLIYKKTEEEGIRKDFGLKNQMRRAAVSIPSNIAEGDELGTNPQSIRHFYYTKGSAAELLTQIILAKEIGYLSEQPFLDMQDKCAKISAMLQKLIDARLVKDHLNDRKI